MSSSARRSPWCGLVVLSWRSRCRQRCDERVGRGAPAGGPGPFCSQEGDHQLLGCAAPEELVAALAGNDDLGRLGEVELGPAGGAEPLAVAGADQVMGRPVDRDRLADAADGEASAAGGCGPDGVWQVSGAEGGERPGQDGGCFAGERGEGADGAGQRWGQHVMLAAVVVVADLGVEPGREDGQQVIGGDVVGCGEPAEVGGEDFPGDQGGWDRQWSGRAGLRRCCRGGRSWCPALPAGVLAHLVALECPAEGLVAARVTQGGHLGEQCPGAQVRVVGEAAAAVVGERQDGVGARGAFWTAPSLIETRFSQILLSGEVSVSSTVTRGALAQPGR